MRDPSTDWLRGPRLYAPVKLGSGKAVTLTGKQAHYLLHVLRLKAGDGFCLFNGEDGEWRCVILETTRKGAVLECAEKLRQATPPPDIDYLFAPLKHARLDYVVQKATEMGARRILPVLTERTVASRVNVDRLKANVIEAAEQCGLVGLPSVEEPRKLASVISGWDEGRALIYCDETASISDPIEALRRLPAGPLAVLIGPEGGFSPVELGMLRALPSAVAISLGPRIMRADTAAVAALALIQAVLGDWH